MISDDRTLADLVKDSMAKEIVVGVPDLHGRLQGKRCNAGLFMERMTSGVEMCGYIVASDIDMTPFDRTGITGWDQGFRDMLVRPELDTARLLSPGTALVLGTPCDDDGAPLRIAPRQVLVGQTESLRRDGHTVKAGIEVEFVLYRRGADGWEPAWSDNLDYSLRYPAAEAGDFLRTLGATLTGARIRWESIKAEGAPGQVEIALAYGDPVDACDDYAVLRHVVRESAAKHDLTPAFMAAPQTGIGSGLHMHLSLWSPDEHPRFAHERGEAAPEVMNLATAGLISALPYLAPMYAPYPNSYKRYQAHSFAPTRFNWGVDNRACAVRVTGHGRAARLEVRLAGADANPYTTLGAYLAAIIHGLKETPALPPSQAGDAYQDDRSLPLYCDLAEAVAAFRHSTIAEELLGRTVVQHYAQAARTELEHHRLQVTDVEQRRGIR
jgi:glutamine synthetase